MNTCIRQFDICIVDLGDGRGSEQIGKRPAIIVQGNKGNTHSPTTIICPLTSSINKKYLPTHVVISTTYGVRQTSILLCEQIRTISMDRISSVVGKIDSKEVRSQILSAIIASLSA
jgi:mRNA interferase MazF